MRPTRNAAFSGALACMVAGCVGQPANPAALPSREPVSAAAPLPRPLGWQLMPALRIAVFSATDPRDYDLTVICEGRQLQSLLRSAA